MLALVLLSMLGSAPPATEDGASFDWLRGELRVQTMVGTGTLCVIHQGELYECFPPRPRAARTEAISIALDLVKALLVTDGCTAAEAMDSDSNLASFTRYSIHAWQEDVDAELQRGHAVLVLEPYLVRLFKRACDRRPLVAAQRQKDAERVARELEAMRRW